MSYTITFSQQEMQVINDALMQMPYYKAAPVVNSINMQLSEKPEKSEKSEKPENTQNTGD